MAFWRASHKFLVATLVVLASIGAALTACSEPDLDPADAQAQASKLLRDAVSELRLAAGKARDLGEAVEAAYSRRGQRVAVDLAAFGLTALITAEEMNRLAGRLIGWVRQIAGDVRASQVEVLADQLRDAAATLTPNIASMRDSGELLVQEYPQIARTMWAFSNAFEAVHETFITAAGALADYGSALR